MSCCLNDLGSFPHNEDINTGIAAPASGLYRLRFAGVNYSKFTKYLNFDAGDDIVIPSGTLNEDAVFTLNIIKPDGSAYSENDCENFSITTFINKVACDDVDYL